MAASLPQVSLTHQIKFPFARDTGTPHSRTQRLLKFGESLALVGNSSELGEWNVDRAVPLKWHPEHNWIVDLNLDGTAEFKCIKRGRKGASIDWEGGDNRVLEVNGRNLEVAFEWGDSAPLKVHEKGQAAGAPEGSSGGGQRGSPAAEDAEEGRVWHGAVRSMQANEHPRDRNGVWETAGLQGPALHLVKGDKDAGSWLGKLQVVRDLLLAKPALKLTQDELAYAFVYLQLINTGAIGCVEGGGHYRPNHHAGLARELFRPLEHILERNRSGKRLHLLARQLHTRLPSFAEAFTASTPLTRIRDIAHRNDIPQELKQEIKHTLQNKLHRNAGPEDLVAAEALLRRITAPGASHSEAFVAEYKVFMGELREFFNAGGLLALLAAMGPSLDDAQAQAVQRYRSAKGPADEAGAGPQALVDALHALLTLRASLLAGLSSGMRNDAPDGAMAMRQRWRLAEAATEKAVFVLLSRLVNALEEQGGAAALAAGGDKGWALPLGACILGLRCIGLGGWNCPECGACENELGAWQQAGGLQEQSNALRLQASLERAQRLTQGLADDVVGLFGERAAVLGKALGLASERTSVFAEAEVRANPAFQLSKLLALLLKAARLTSGAAEWDALVAGKARGRLVEAAALEPGLIREGADPTIALVKAASGDEELGALGPSLRGIILSHTLPHLSHLGVRARQVKLPFALCEDTEALEKDVRPLIGQVVEMTVGPGSLQLGPAGADSPDSAGDASPSQQTSSSGNAALQKLQKGTEPVELADATPASCGAKAASCAQLTLAAEQSRGSAAFFTPPGVALPFGCMEAALEAAGKAKEVTALVARLEGQGPGAELDRLCTDLQRLVASCPLDESTAEALCGRFLPRALLMARSSANVEDLKEVSGAGLYDSVGDVAASDPAALGRAVARVWASLYTRRAVLSRRAAGVRQSEAAMAVLVQQQLEASLSFVLHTRSPVAGDGSVYAEVALGLGETLASGLQGTPWRFSVAKAGGAVDTLAFANLSTALFPRRGRFLVDYSRQALSLDQALREDVAKCLGAVGAHLEAHFGGPQDIEGALVGGTDLQLHVVQSRPQPGAS